MLITASGWACFVPQLSRTKGHKCHQTPVCSVAVRKGHHIPAFPLYLVGKSSGKDPGVGCGDIPGAEGDRTGWALQHPHPLPGQQDVMEPLPSGWAPGSWAGFGVLGEPPKSQAHGRTPQEPPAPSRDGQGCSHKAQQEKRVGTHWDKLRSWWIRQGTAPGPRCHIPVSLPLHPHRVGARGCHRVPCAPRTPSAPGRGVGNAPRLRSCHKGAASFLCCWCHGNLSHLA